MKRILRVAAAQTEIKEKRYEANIENALELIKSASEQRADVICFPEMFTTGVLPDPEEENGKTKNIMSEYAEKYSLHIIAGTIIERRNGGLYNTSYVFDEEGKVLSKYDKGHLYPLEKNIRRAGAALPPIFEINGVKIAVIICIELIIPEVARILALNGVQVVFCPSFVEAWGGGNTAGEERRRFCLARAAENQIFVVDVCGSGTTSFYKEQFGIMPLSGYSTIAGFGLLSELISGADAQQKLLIGELNMEAIDQKRNQVPVLHSRRPELYGELI